MKKLSALIALMMSVSVIKPCIAMADPEDGYVPLMYMSAECNDKFSIMPDGTVYINNQTLNGDDSIRINIYIRDDSKSCWTIAPKIKSNQNIKFNEHASESENIPYSSEHEFIESLDEEYNTINITFKTPMFSTGTKLEVTSENTDDYPIAYFNASINPEISAGSYQIYFLTEPEDYSDQRTTSISFRYDNGQSATFTPETENLNIIVSDRPFGDVNNDGIIDAVDASSILAEYASLSTEQGSTFSSEEYYSANINMDEFIDAVDATALLGYYAYTSTGGELSLTEYLLSI